MMDMYGFYTGKIFDAYEYLGAHISGQGTIFRVFAPNAEKVSIIGDFSEWTDIPMEKVYDGNFYECFVPEAKEGMRYKVRIYEKSGRFLDHGDPYGYGMEVRPQNCSIIRNMDKYIFHDNTWMKKRKDGVDRAVNIYEVHLGSWKMKDAKHSVCYTYSEFADRIIPYLKENSYNYLEIMPICEYPCDESWGYQALGFYSPTSRYGSADELKQMVDKCHQNDIGVLLDFAPVHFAVDDFGLANFDGTPLYEYPHVDVGYNEWGSRNFAHSRGEVRSFLQSAVFYWLKEYHFDGIRMDAISNMIYWQGNPERGVNKNAVSFIQYMNQEIKKQDPSVMLIAEDSTAFEGVTKSVEQGGLGFDYKWDMGWMNDTLEYFKEDTDGRIRDYYKLTFSMQYFYSERFLLPLSHDEVVHGKATIMQKMNGQYEQKFPQARVFYMYMYAHPGKKLNFMGNEIGQMREWDEKREQDWDLAAYPKHNSFRYFMRRLGQFYLANEALYKNDYGREGFLWTDCHNQERCIYTFIRKTPIQSILTIFNLSEKAQEEYRAETGDYKNARLVFDSNWECFGGNLAEKEICFEIVNQEILMDLEPFSAKYLILK